MDSTRVEIIEGLRELVVRHNGIDELTKVLCKEKQVYCPVIHHFYPGIYMREVNFPAGAFAIGRMQKFHHVNMMLKGRMTIIEQDGAIRDIEAPLVFLGTPGQKMGYVHEDVSWINVYDTAERDVETIENTYLGPSPIRNLNSNPNHDAREDYSRFLEETGITEEFIRTESEIEDNIIPFPYGVQTVAVYDSNIEGKGLYASVNFLPGDVICLGKLGEYRTPAGRYTNHSGTPNAAFQWHGDDVLLVAIQPINGCHGGDCGQEITVDYRGVLKDIHNYEV